MNTRLVLERRFSRALVSRSLTAVLVAVALELGGAFSAQADGPPPGAIYVDAAAAPGGDGSQTAPFQTIAAALSVVSSNGTVVVAAGTYAEGVRLTPPQVITLQGGWNSAFNTWDPVAHRTVVDGQGLHQLIVITGGTGWVVDGIVFANGYGGNAAAMAAGGEGIVRNCVFTNNVTTTSLLANADGAAMLSEGVPPRIIHVEDSVFINNTVGRRGVVHYASGSELYFDRCRFTSNYVADQTLVRISGSPGPMHIQNSIFDHNRVRRMFEFRSGANHFYNNTFYGNISPTSSDQIFRDEGATTVALINNIIACNTNMASGNLARFTGVWTIYNNLLFNNPGWNDNLGANNLVGQNPLLVNPVLGVGDFGLQAGSPAIDAGAELLTVTDDFNGNPRPAGSGHDIGAIEYGADDPTQLPPAIVDIAPASGTRWHPVGGGVSFRVTTQDPNVITNIQLFLNDVASGELTITGPLTNRTANYAAALTANTFYTARAEAQDQAGRRRTRIWTFDTFDEAVAVTIEGEDYNYGRTESEDPAIAACDPGSGLYPPVLTAGGRFQDNPLVSGYSLDTFPVMVNGGGVGYAQLVGMPEADCHDAYVGDKSLANNIYRSCDAVGVQTSEDLPRRSKYDVVVNGEPRQVREHEVTGIVAGDWMNYTRTFPTTNYLVYLRYSSSAAQKFRLDRVLSDRTQTNQTTATVGEFHLTAGAGYRYAPLTDEGGQLLMINLSGVTTLRLTAMTANNNVQLNYLVCLPMADPPMLYWSRTATQLILNWEVVAGYQLKAADEVTGPYVTVSDAMPPQYSVPLTGSRKFYRLAP